MKTIDANNIDDQTEFQSDICIIGGGAAGITIAKHFVNCEVSVTVIESGGTHFDERTQSLYDIENIGHDLRSQRGYVSRNRYLGGSTNTWMGQCAPLSPIDFTPRDWVPNSGWPISFSDLDNFYRKASQILKLPDYDFFIRDTWKKFLIGKNKNCLSNSEIIPTLFLLAQKPVNMRTAYTQELEGSKNVQIILNANVTSLRARPACSTVSQVEAITLSRKRLIVKAKYYILACGGWENARLLLVSDQEAPSGLGNQYDNVGRYYMEHPKVFSGRLTPMNKTIKSPIILWKKRIDKNGYFRSYFRLTDQVQKEHQLLNNCIEITYPQKLREAIASSENLLSNLKFSKSTIHELIKFSPSLFRLAESLERMMLNLPVRFEHFLINNHMEQVPKRDSRVCLGAERDEIGMRKLKVNLLISQHEKQSMIDYQRIFGDSLELDSCAALESEFPDAGDDWPGLTDSSHHMGTTRMSALAANGVVDKDCKVFDLDNLYIAGSSIFPTGGHVNPTLTVVALAERLADHLSTKLRRSR